MIIINVTLGNTKWVCWLSCYIDYACEDKRILNIIAISFTVGEKQTIKKNTSSGM